MDDRIYYEIVVTTKENKTDTITAYALTAKYRLPWTNGNWKSYNPAIAELFETIGGNEGFVETEKARLYEALIKAIYRKYLEPEIGWKLFKKEHPLISSGFSKTLSPKLYRNYDGQQTMMHFSSSKLPSHIRMTFSYPKPDTLHHREITYEQALVEAYKKGNFLFSPLKANRDFITIFNPVDFTKRSFDIIARHYPGIAKFDFHDILLLYRMDGYSDMGTTSNVSSWLILPNNTSILLMYTGKVIKDQQQKFTHFINTNNSTQNNVCIVFDSSGKQIAGNDDPVILRD